MRRRLLVSLAGFAVLSGCALVPLVLAGGASEADGPKGFVLALDCDVATAGVQENCTFPSGTTSVDVDVVFQNNTASATTFAAVQFNVLAPQQVLNPPSVADPTGLDANPDFDEPNETSWNCSLVGTIADSDPSPTVAVSSLGCFDIVSDGPVVAGGTSRRVATIHYNAVDGPATLTFDPLGGGQVGDNVGVPLVDCPTTGECVGAHVQIGDVLDTPTPPGTATPTNTPPPPPPTATPTPTMTNTPLPTLTPNGGVESLLGLNNSVCTALGVALEGVPPIDAATLCLTLDQYQLQAMLRCIRVDRELDPTIPCLYDGDVPNGVLVAQPEDFANIDHDGDQVHAGVRFAVLAFVTGDYPVTFETDLGEFVAGGSSYVCSAVTDDPDCDAVPHAGGLHEDGVVVGMLMFSLDTPRGEGHVTVTQNGISQSFRFTVVGPPESIELELVNGKDTIRSGATGCDPAFPFTYDHLIDEAENGTSDPERTVIMTRALDDQGHEVVGALLRFSNPYEPPTFPEPMSAHGGVMFILHPTIDLEVAGSGFPQIVCSRDVPGIFETTATFARGVSLSPYSNPDASATIQVNVVDELPTATPTETDTPTSTPTPTATDTPTATPTATDTPTPSNTFTSTPTVTNTPDPNAPTLSPTPIPTPPSIGCVVPGQRVSLLIGIARRLGAEEGDRRYKARYDVTGDGVIDARDLLAVMAAPRCAPGA